MSAEYGSVIAVGAVQSISDCEGFVLFIIRLSLHRTTVVPGL